MNGNVLRILAVFLILSAFSQAAVRSVMSSQFLVRGEEVILEIRVQGQEPDRLPMVPQIRNVVVESIGFGKPRMFPGRRVESSFQYVVSSYQIGKHEIPPIEVMVNGSVVRTAPVPFEVFDPNELAWNEVESKPAGERIRYAGVFKVPERKYYENQSMAAEIKIFIPADLARSVADWGVPDFEKEGLTAWRFEPSDARGQVNLLGHPYVTRSYQTSMNAIRPGEAAIGPASVRLTYSRMVFDRFAQRIDVEANLEIPKLSFEVLPLPKGAPEGFDNAVGDFTIEAVAKETSVTEGEPLSVDVVVSGTGNLDNLRSPALVDSSGWKIYDATPMQRGEERRDLTGSVVFSQFIRPLEMKSGIPPFRLVFFNPDTEKYETVTTPPILLNMTPASGAKNFESSGPPPALPLPVERMSDILGLIKNGPLLASPGATIPWWLGHLFAAALSLFLIGRVLWLRFGHVLEKDPVKIKRKKEFQEVSKAAAEGGTTFLKAAGAFVEKWLSPAEDPDLRMILEERDRLCFTPSKVDTVLPKGRRDEILSRIRSAAFLLTLAAVTMSTIQHAAASERAVEAYESAKFEDAARLWLEAGPYDELSADTLYNIGNAAYRMGAPGQASLYYRRALARDASHEEARQNLRFIERKYGSITVERPAYQYAVAKFPLAAWKGILWCGAWMLILGLLVFPATRRGSKWRIAGVVGYVVGPLLVSLGLLGWRYFPDDSNYAPLAKQAVIVGPKVVLHTDAARTSPEVIDAPPGSLAEILQRSGRWAYVSFATQTRGWVRVESFEMVIPEKKPEPPKVKKSSADGSSA